MWVTLYADASFDRQGGGAWAVWLRCARGRLVRRGACPRWVTSSNEAELAAIYDGVSLALEEWPFEVDGFSLRSDSQAALGQADHSMRPPRDPAMQRLRDKLHEAARAADVELSAPFSTTGGHPPRKTRRSLQREGIHRESRAVLCNGKIL